MQSVSVAIHAVVGIFTFGALQFPGMFFAQIAKSKNVGAIRQAFPIALVRGRIFGPLSILVALMGVWLAVERGIPLNSGWLVASYVVFVILAVLGLGFHTRWESRVNALAQSSPLDAPSPELVAAIDDPLEAGLKWVSAAGLAAALLFHGGQAVLEETTRPHVEGRTVLLVSGDRRRRYEGAVSKMSAYDATPRPSSEGSGTAA